MAGCVVISCFGVDRRADTRVCVNSQNNGVIALTRCASRSAGYAAGGFMLLFGIFGKLAGWVLTIPPCVLGGVMAFVFASIGVVGFKVRAYVL